MYFFSKRRTSRFAALAAAALCLLAALAPPAAAQSLSSPKLKDDYIRTTFTVEDGLPDNVVNAITETANGLLWVGTDAGLASFDGRQFNLIDLHTNGAPAQASVHALLESSKGDLWVGTDAGVVVIPRLGVTQFNPAQLRFYPAGDPRGNDVEVLFEGHDGTIWAGTAHGLYSFRSGRFEPVNQTISVLRIHQTSSGHLLLATSHGYTEWDGQKLVPHPELSASLGLHPDQIFDAMQDGHGAMWYSTNRGLVRNLSGALQTFQPVKGDISPAFRTKVDPQGNVWATTGHGLYRVEGSRMESPAPEVASRAFYLGHGGEIWIGTNGFGLLHLALQTVHIYTQADGLPRNTTMAVLAAHDGTLWVGSNCGLSVWNGQQFRKYERKDGLLNACVTSLAQDQDQRIWIGTWGGGLFRFQNGHFVQYSVENGLPTAVVLQILVAHDGSLWIATTEGISHMRDGRFMNYSSAAGISTSGVISVYQDHSGTIWAATQAGIRRFSGDRFVPIASTPTDSGTFTVGFAENSRYDLYALSSPRGISRIEGDGSALVNVNSDLNVLNMVESRWHDLWFSSKNGIYRVRAEDLQKSIVNRSEPLDYERFDRSDGMHSVQCGDGSPNLAITPDSKLWVATVNGLAMIDLTKISPLRRPPRVFVGAVTLGTNTVMAGSRAILPAGTHHVEFHLEVVDLASPEKVRIQYRLDGVDKTWLDADVSRTASYSNLPAGTHAFHVRASGNDGVWDRQGIVYPVTQEPYLYETSWFHLVIVGTVILLLSIAYLVRMRQVVLRTRILLEERIVERERIARELHDTLLQGVLSAAMQLDVAEDRLPESSPVKPLLREILEMMRQVTEEGRRALRGLREPDPEIASLAVALSRIGKEIALDRTTGYRVITIGTARTLIPRIYDEVYRIAREAVVNAFVHAHATLIETELEYADQHLRILVRDDGKGIDSHILETGREGHWGLTGMRERAEGMGAALKLRSRVSAGTEVELTVPAAIAFGDDQHPPLSRWLRNILGGSYGRPERTGKGRHKREHDKSDSNSLHR